jgi:hypothetical protein
MEGLKQVFRIMGIAVVAICLWAGVIRLISFITEKI